MKSSPFKLFSLSAREADQKGNYANPRLGRYRPTTFENPDLSGIKSSKAEPREKVIANYKPPSDRGQVEGRGSSKGVDLSSEKIITNKEIPGAGKVNLKQAYENRNMDEYGDMTPTEFNKVAKADPLYGTSGSKGSTQRNKTTNIFADGKLIKTYDNPIGQMKGSPVKHNAGAVGSIAGANPLAGGIAGIGQQISNQAQQRAADAGGSTSVDPFLPPPNQVAETGSYGSGGDRDMLEMNGNQINNQSIGRNTDVASQLFGSGQRASMLAMKGTPLHDKGHANDYEGHTHRKTGKSYEVGEFIDETDFESLNTSLNAYDRGEIKKDKKSQFIVSKNEDYNPTKIDTIRPKNGKQFKMGWGDAERNISTNPKYPRSN